MANYIEARLAQFRADAEKQIQFHANRRLSMTDQQRPITPPPELVQQWREQAPRYRDGGVGREDWLTARAAQWGADMELEACCALTEQKGFLPSSLLRATRRPKPPSLKEQALMALEDGDTGPGASLTAAEVSIIRRALEALPND